MVFDLTFEEAMDILINRIGWVQGEKFDEHEYLTIDRKSDHLIKNVVEDGQIGCIHDYWGDQTREAWTDARAIQDEIKTQKYRFILVLNRDSVKGTGAYSRGNSRDSYLWYKSINKR